MALIDHLFAGIQTWTSAKLPSGDIQSLVSDGVVGGVGGILVFLPQICILFFALSLVPFFWWLHFLKKSERLNKPGPLTSKN